MLGKFACCADHTAGRENEQRVNLIFTVGDAGVGGNPLVGCSKELLRIQGVFGRTNDELRVLETTQQGERKH